MKFGNFVKIVVGVVGVVVMGYGVKKVVDYFKNCDLEEFDFDVIEDVEVELEEDDIVFVNVEIELV